MSTTIRPELSEKNQYWIDKHRYGFTDEEYQALYPTKEEVCGYEDDEDDEDDEYNGETYDEVYGELSDD